MSRKLILIFLSLSIILVASGCQFQEKQNIEENNISVVSVVLTCIQVCLDTPEKPFDQKTLTDQEHTQTFTRAVEGAEKMNGILNYAAFFLMEITFSDGAVNSYHLGIGEEKGGTGLLVNLLDGHYGYTINEGMADQLSDLIYGSE